MVDVSSKEKTLRRARAEAVLHLSSDAADRLRAGNLPKGSPIEVVRLTALQAVKQTSQLLPLCHPLRLTGIEVRVEQAGDRCWRIEVEVSATDRTGVEMEALTGASVGALALYDMVKAVDRSAVIERVRLLEKSGGKSGHFQRESSDG
jgi:cyclic pyranopterin phosphate synthase